MKRIAGILALAALAGCTRAEESTIVPYGRESTSGTYDYFREQVLGGEEYAPEVRRMPGTSSLVGAIQRDPLGLGYAGLAYQAGVKALRLRRDGASPGYAPTLENAQKGFYPLTRSLYLYTVGPPEGLARSFIEWVRGDEGQRICKTIGYFPLPEWERTSGEATPPPGKHLLTIQGSDTLRILTSLWAERFMQLYPDCRVEVSDGGSGAGIVHLIDGSAMMCQSSRPLRPSEIEEIRTKHGRAPEGAVVAVDGLAVFVNEKNPIEELSLGQLKAVYTGKVRRWADLKSSAP